MSEAGILRVVIADDHPLFRMGLAYALRAQGFEITAEAATGREALAACRAVGVDVVLMDVKMPDMNGIEACRALQDLARPPLVVMLTTFDEPAVIQAAREAGAVGYLSKETDAEKLARLLREIVAYPERGWLPPVRVPSLTRRESEVLALLAGGDSNKLIARRLGISPETVKDYLGGLYRKLEVRDRLSAVQRARELGILP